MQRYYQTIARVLSAVAAFAALAWLMWPMDVPIVERGEAILAFVVTFAFWLATEIKESEEVIFRTSTKNDIRVARELISYSSDRFRTLLKDHDFRKGLPPQYLSEADLLVREVEAGVTTLQDRRLSPLFDDFIHELRIFCNYYALHSSPETIGSVHVQTVVPRQHYNAYDLPNTFQDQVIETNRLASRAWDSLIKLIARIKERVPEAFDEPIEYEWFRSKRIYSRKPEDDAD